MTAKDAKVGVKRKAPADGGSGKGKADGGGSRTKTKKPRMAESAFAPKSKATSKTPQKPADNDSDDTDGFSDEEDGGVRLDDGPGSSKAPADDADKANDFDRAGLTSRESHAKQKQLALERRAAKPLADEVHRTKKIWERLRRKSHVPKEERQKLVEELFGIITGRCRDFVLKHDAVRAVQTAIKYATADQRRQIARELAGSYAQLAESRYAKFLIGKLLVHGDAEARDLVVSDFYGKVRRLINHAEASWILDDVYRTVATKEQRARLLREWYGPEFSLAGMSKDREAAPTADLIALLTAEPARRSPVMKTLMHMINALVQKKMTGFTMLHDAMLQYYGCAAPGSEERAELAELVKGDESGDLAKNMAFTESGARLSCLLLANGTAKDRKQLLKAYKDTILLMAGDGSAHLVLLTAYDVVDDTKLVSKTIFPELLGSGDKDAKVDDKAIREMAQNLVGAVQNTSARTTLLYPFEGLSRTLFPAGHGLAREVLEQVHEARKTTSKKDADVRRWELVAACAPQLLAAIAAEPAALTSTAFGCQLVADVLLSEAEGKEQALEAVAQSAAGDPKAGGDGEGGEDEMETLAAPTVHMSRTPHGGRLLKSLLQGGRFDRAAGKVVQVGQPLGFADLLWPVIKDHVVDWATGPSSFVVVAMAEATGFDAAGELMQRLRKSRKALETAATEPTPEQVAARAAREAREEEEEEEEDGGKAKGKTKTKSKAKAKAKGGKAEPAVGNTGSRILLEKLAEAKKSGGR